MGKIPSKDLINTIEKVATKNKKVYGAHNIKVDYLGSYAVASLHIELDENMSLEESHEIAHLVQNSIVNEIDVIKSVTAHSCPVGLKYDHKQEIDK